MPVEAAMPTPILNPFYEALTTSQSSIAVINGHARRYPADVIPFAALESPTHESLHALAQLLAPNEIIYLTGLIGDPLPQIPEIEHALTLPGWQLHYTALIPPPEPSTIRELTAEDVPAMVALTDAAFPGYFRPRTYTLGRYFGIHVDNQLVAMAGERICLPELREISAICTHPAHTGKGYAALLTRHILRVHAENGLHSFLHTLAANTRALSLYERLGFTRTTAFTFNQLRRRPAP